MRKPRGRKPAKSIRRRGGHSQRQATDEHLKVPYPRPGADFRTCSCVLVSLFFLTAPALLRSEIFVSDSTALSLLLSFLLPPFLPLLKSHLCSSQVSIIFRNTFTHSHSLRHPRLLSTVAPCAFKGFFEYHWVLLGFYGCCVT